MLPTFQDTSTFSILPVIITLIDSFLKLGIYLSTQKIDKKTCSIIHKFNLNQYIQHIQIVFINISETKLNNLTEISDNTGVHIHKYKYIFKRVEEI